ncbi:MAG: hypothetical protein ACRC6G_01050 [Deefgea sp.]
MQLQYKKRRSYKYTLAAPYLFECSINIDSEVNTYFIRLSKTGQLFINTAYSWDGASGPMPDLSCVMRASLIHDALYQLMREQHLPQSYRSMADRLLYELCLADGMNPILAKCVYFCVRQFGQRHAGNDLLVLNPRN